MRPRVLDLNDFFYFVQVVDRGGLGMVPHDKVAARKLGRRFLKPTLVSASDSIRQI
jgi:hypothetical protein